MTAVRRATAQEGDDAGGYDNYSRFCDRRGLAVAPPAAAC